MKKLFTLLAIAALALSACAQNQPASQGIGEVLETVQEAPEEPPEAAAALPQVAAHELEGEWAWVDGDTYLYVFNADGTGRRGVNRLQEDFEWYTEGAEHLFLMRPVPGSEEAEREEWTFAIENDTLTLASGEVSDMTFRYTRIQELLETADLAGHELVGDWAWERGEEYVYTFNADGTGQRGITELQDEFTWSVRGGDHLILDTGIIEESWTFGITDDALTIVSRQVEGVTYTYLRAE